MEVVPRAELTRSFLVLLAVAVGAGIATAQDPPRRWVMPPPPEGVLMEKDVPYLEPGRQEKLDLYLPEGRSPGSTSPAVLILHGGGWSSGDKGNAREFNIGTTLAKAGYVCASANYMLEKSQRWPTILFDVKNAVRFLRANAAKYRIDPERIGVIGGSAGGHLALMIAYTAGMKDLEPIAPYPGVSSSVAAVVDMYGPSNLLTRQRTAPDGTPTGQVRLDSVLLPRSAEEDPALWKIGSPISHVRKDVPPTLILHGTADTTVDRDQSTSLAEALKQAGATYELIMLQGVGHTFTLETWENKPLPRDLRPVVVGFFDKHLKR